MTRQRGQFVTQWSQAEGAWRPRVPDGFRGVVQDVTGQAVADMPPVPNVLVVEAWGEAAALDLWANDPQCLELWREELTHA